MPDPLDALHELGATSMSIGEAYRIDLNDERTGSLNDLALLERILLQQIVLHELRV